MSSQVEFVIVGSVSLATETSHAPGRADAIS